MIFIACTIYAFTTKTDFTMGRAMIFLLSMALMMLVIFLLIFGPIRNEYGIAYNIVLALCVVLLGIFLIHDTQLIVGKGKWRLGLDDYIVGALIIYVDLITIFLYLLALFGKK